MSRSLSALIPALVVLSVGIWWVSRTPQSPPPPALTPDSTHIPAEHPSLAPLGQQPDWKSLDAFQHSITRREFEYLLTTLFTTGDAWRESITIENQHATIRTNSLNPEETYTLEFAEEASPVRPPHLWRSGKDLPASSDDRPLTGLRIAIDPGHIGGEWAKMEERWFQLQGAAPVCEGDLTLQVAKLLKPALEALGAEVQLVREKAEPLTPLRPNDLRAEITESGDEKDLRKLAERLFYRTAEIRERAKRVNEVLKPDLVLCLHFNAEPWGSSNSPTLVDRNHFHLLLNGGYTDDEVRMDDQRFELLRKLLQRTLEEEASIGQDVADSFFRLTALPPYLYNLQARNARMVQGNPYLWARNLLANRLYDCPVIFLEPYVMNCRTDYVRIQAGDYHGERLIEGQNRPSIFREYVNALTEGLAAHYRRVRPQPR